MVCINNTTYGWLLLVLDCNHSYCKNGGTCTTINGGTGYMCKCTDGWIGSNCQLVGKTFS